MNALIVEDDRNMAGLLESWLRDLGCTEIRKVDNIADAMAALQATTQNIITLDLNLRETRVEETLPYITKMRLANPDALLVVVSGVITEKDVQRITELGADAAAEKLSVPTQTTFMQKLRDVVGALLKNPVAYQSRIPGLEMLSQKIAKACGADKCENQAPAAKPPETL